MSRIPPSIPSFSETGLIHFDLSFLGKILSGPVVIHAVSLNIDMPEHFLSFPDISKAINYFYTVKNCSHVPVIQISSCPEFPDAIVILVDGRLLSSCLNQDCAYDPYLKAYSDVAESVISPAGNEPDDIPHVDVMDTMDSVPSDDDVETKGNVDTDLKDSDLEMPPDFNPSDLDMSSVEQYPLDEVLGAEIGEEPDEKPKSLKKFISRLRK